MAAVGAQRGATGIGGGSDVLGTASNKGVDGRAGKKSAGEGAQAPVTAPAPAPGR